MKYILPLFPLLAALGLVACQGNNDPIAEDAAAPPDHLVGDVSAEGLAAPANAGAAEAVDMATVPVVPDGMVWSTGPAGSANFGPRGTRPVLTLACKGDSLSVTREYPATPGTTGTLSFTGGGAASSMPMRAIAKPGGPGESQWQGQARGDMARAVARAFSRGGQVEVTLGGAPALSVPTSPIATAVFKRCAA
jgi:hypothetical protein